MDLADTKKNLFTEENLEEHADAIIDLERKNLTIYSD